MTQYKGYNDMNAMHLHLLVNHMPLAFALAALFTLIVGWIGKSAAIKKVSLALMVLVGLASATAYLSGSAAEESGFGEGSARHAFLERHEELAQVAWIVGLVPGVLGLIGLVVGRRMQDVPLLFVVLPLVALLVSMWLFARTANLGGQIMHPETRSDGLSRFLNGS